MNSQNQPRKLTEYEIEYIMNNMPTYITENSYVKSNPTHAHEWDVAVCIGDNLRNIKISPSNIQNLINDIQNKIMDTECESIAPTIWQLHLNMLHSSGYNLRVPQIGLLTKRAPK